ncbi:Neutral trehalase [Wickerhamiella sorbophila]|uniref:Trehalase n=1 Tax=Wickerhamiella sorbophila TaxID=45607 RepID=A0A2T0FHM6_9ASCO|nr:Neutral trehalase [Wickerhamiella sorbophila]PRT54490.1 Neutral trehalase [Wickerhamiella sorbophila]
MSGETCGDVKELRRKVKGFWRGLVRSIEPDTIRDVIEDPKMPGASRLYVPTGDSQAQELDNVVNVEVLPKLDQLTPDFVFSLNKKPGLLALATENGKPLPYIVPGGRFNEFYGWDSYFIGLGLLADGFVDEARAIVTHFVYEIEHYGKILNANRSYYLNRSQPPFLTDLARKVYDKTQDKGFLIIVLKAAVEEYESVWNSPPRLDKTGLSRYRPDGHGIPPETEPGHFNWALEGFAKKYNKSIEEFIELYNTKAISEPQLDEFLLHDRAMRESGHDTSSRFENVVADLATIDLNALLYKYERDILEFASLIGEDPKKWHSRSEARKAAVDKYLWSETEQIYYDYNTKTNEPHRFASVTTFWAMWSGLASPEQARQMVASSLPLFEQPGGLCVAAKAPKSAKQWDFPCGWAPHQILAWQGLRQYGFVNDAERLETKWAAMVATTWQRTGKVLEKYNVCDIDHAEDVSAEYGNQGSQENGFGWTNASIALAV